jgi:carboxypeptidase C (cathepsin A)
MSALRRAALFAALLFACAPIAAHAQEDEPTPAPTSLPIPSTKDSVTQHTITLGGKKIAYTARAGSLLLRDTHGGATASVFYVAYTANGADPRTRPVTFFWNGGPGSSTIWLHMGSFGPVRVDVPKDASQPGPLPRLHDNPSSLLDTSDLVFIDAVGTGWSTLVGHGTAKEYYGIDEDAAAFAQFIERWTTRNARWPSPKFLFGESYGTTRAPNVAHVLFRDGMAINGIVLLSSVLDYNFILNTGPGEDYTAIAYLPSEAAVAWYHHKVPGNPPDLERFVDAARTFAGGEYAHALLLGDKLDEATRTEIVHKLHAFTGLSETYIRAANLRINSNRFRQELLRDEGTTLGRYDARYSGHDLDPNSAYADYDPSDTMGSAAFIAAFNDYAFNTLRYRDDRLYNVLDYQVNRQWKYQRDDDSSAPSVVSNLKEDITTNPSLYVLSANSYFDLATPFFGTEYLLKHMDLDPSERRRVQFVYFRSGHEAYLNRDSLVAFKARLVQFYHDALAH